MKKLIVAALLSLYPIQALADPLVVLQEKSGGVSVVDLGSARKSEGFFNVWHYHYFILAYLDRKPDPSHETAESRLLVQYNCKNAQMRELASRVYNRRGAETGREDGATKWEYIDPLEPEMVVLKYLCDQERQAFDGKLVLANRDELLSHFKADYEPKFRILID